MPGEPAENTLGAAEPWFLHRRLFRWHEASNRHAAIGDDNLFAGLGAFNELRKFVLGFEDIDLHLFTETYLARLYRLPGQIDKPDKNIDAATVAAPRQTPWLFLFYSLILHPASNF